MRSYVIFDGVAHIERRVLNNCVAVCKLCKRVFVSHANAVKYPLLCAASGAKYSHENKVGQNHRFQKHNYLAEKLLLSLPKTYLHATQHRLSRQTARYLCGSKLCFYVRRQHISTDFAACSTPDAAPSQAKARDILTIIKHCAAVLHGYRFKRRNKRCRVIKFTEKRHYVVCEV